MDKKLKGRFDMEKERILSQGLENKQISFMDVFIYDRKGMLTITISSLEAPTDIESIIELAEIICKKPFIHSQVWEETGLYLLELTQAPKLQLDFAYSGEAQRDYSVSGDSILVKALSGRKMLLGISDGMGSGKEAKRDSERYINLLYTMMKGGFHQKTAMELINQMNITYDTERFTTMDICVVDLEGHIEFTKMAAAPSFFYHQGEMIRIDSHGLPVGIVEEIYFSTQKKKLFPGDYFLLFSDGFWDAIKGGPYEQESWVIKKLEALASISAADTAATLLHEVKKQAGFYLPDDVSVVVGKISKR